MISALTITDTTFFASEANYTIFVDRIVLDNVTVTSGSIQFHILNSTGSNFTNTNTTFDAVASFFDLAVNLTVRNVNTSSDLFNSTVGNQDFNATITPGQVITILASPSVTSDCSTSIRNIMTLILIISALALLIFGISLFFFKGEVLLNIKPQHMITIFIALIIGIVFIIAIADNIVLFCP